MTNAYATIKAQKTAEIRDKNQNKNTMMTHDEINTIKTTKEIKSWNTTI